MSALHQCLGPFPVRMYDNTISSLQRFATRLIRMAHVHDQQFEDAAQQTAQRALANAPPVLMRRFLLRLAEIIEHSEEYLCSPSRCAVVCEMCPRTCARGCELHNRCRCFFHQTTGMVPVRASIASRRLHTEEASVVLSHSRGCVIGSGTAQDRQRSRSPR